MNKQSKFFKITASILIALFSNLALFPGYPQVPRGYSGFPSVTAPKGLPSPKQFIPLSSTYSLPMLKGIKLNPDNPLKIDFIIDTASKGDVDEEEASRLIRYFLAGLTLPEKELWVNLSPYEKERVASDNLALTDLGKDMLSQDYVLKQLLSSLTYPESKIGKDYWQKTYQEVAKIAGTTNTPINTFNKVWIMPDRCVVYENGNVAFVKEASLKIMMEEDYLALSRQKSPITNNQSPINNVASKIMKEIVLPKIEDDINNGQNFAKLRQIYHSMVLAVWFKQKFRHSFYKHYIEQGKIEGIDLEDKEIKEKIYSLYIEAYEKGVYNYIKRDYDHTRKKILERKYFSGGIHLPGQQRLEVLLAKIDRNYLKTEFKGRPRLARSRLKIYSDSGTDDQVITVFEFVATATHPKIVENNNKIVTDIRRSREELYNKPEDENTLLLGEVNPLEIPKMADGMWNLKELVDRLGFVDGQGNKTLNTFYGYLQTKKYIIAGQKRNVLVVLDSRLESSFCDSENMIVYAPDIPKAFYGIGKLTERILSDSENLRNAMTGISSELEITSILDLFHFLMPHRNQKGVSRWKVENKLKEMEMFQAAVDLGRAGPGHLLHLVNSRRKLLELRKLPVVDKVYELSEKPIAKLLKLTNSLIFEVCFIKGKNLKKWLAVTTGSEDVIKYDELREIPLYDFLPPIGDISVAVHNHFGKARILPSEKDLGIEHGDEVAMKDIPEINVITGEECFVHFETGNIKKEDQEKFIEVYKSWKKAIIEEELKMTSVSREDFDEINFRIIEDKPLGDRLTKLKEKIESILTLPLIEKTANIINDMRKIGFVIEFYPWNRRNEEVLDMLIVGIRPSSSLNNHSEDTVFGGVDLTEDSFSMQVEGRNESVGFADYLYQDFDELKLEDIFIEDISPSELIQRFSVDNN